MPALPPFGGPEHVLGYLGRYTHCMAISNHRIARLRRRTRQLSAGAIIGTAENSVSCPSRPRSSCVASSCMFLAQGFRTHPPLRPAGESLSQTTASPGAHPARRPGLAAAAAVPAADLQTSGTVPAAAHPCASLKALHRCTTLFRRLGFLMNVACQSALSACSTHVALNRVLTRFHHHSVRRSNWPWSQPPNKDSTCNCSAIFSTRGDGEGLKE